jgi:hypothetical protein
MAIDGSAFWASPIRLRCAETSLASGVYTPDAGTTCDLMTWGTDDVGLPEKSYSLHATR